MEKVVAIVGRPNVGKSTIFNRLTTSRKAIVDEQPGVTRDRHYGKCNWIGKTFTLIDTGGYVSGSEDVFEEEIRKQVEIAITEAAGILFIVDVLSGVTDLDIAVAEVLRKSKKPVYVAVNKVDNNERIMDSHEFHSLGLGELFCVSAINGSGTGELLDVVVKDFPLDEDEESPDPDLPRFSIVGRPNVGKSSLVNTLVGKERNIVTDIAGTTRDTINTRFRAFDFDFILTDTAGLRKKAKVHEEVEFYSVIRTIKAIENCDVVILLLDATEDITVQDLNIFHLAHRNHKGVVILVNKWDLVEKSTESTKKYEERIREKIAPFTNVPIIFTSVTKKQRIIKALEVALEVFQNRLTKIKTSKLNDLLLPIIEMNPPPSNKGKYIKIKYITQLPTHAPSFAFFCNLPQYIKEPYKRFIENKLRENFKFTGVPVRIFFRKK